MKIYISGPMTGYRDDNKPAFKAVAEDLRARGFEVVNPAELAPPGLTWGEYMRIDIAALCTCQMVVTLPAWYKSKGAKAEVYIAEDLLKMPVEEYETFIQN